MLAIVDYGIGNLHSVAHAFRRTGVEVRVTSDPAEVAAADKLVLPGVGSLAAGMANLESYGLRSVLEQMVLSQGRPILGICLGMQMFTRRSDEGDVAGLGWIDAETRRLPFHAPTDPKVPHLGWNEVSFSRTSPLLTKVPGETCFYFAHSFHVVCDAGDDVLGTTSYGPSFVSAVEHGNIWGVQFHPEKSHIVGQQLIRNFVEQC